MCTWKIVDDGTNKKNSKGSNRIQDNVKFSSSDNAFNKAHCTGADSTFCTVHDSAIAALYDPVGGSHVSVLASGNAL